MKLFQLSYALVLSFLFICCFNNSLEAQSPTTAPSTEITEDDFTGIGRLGRAIEKRVFPKRIGDFEGRIVFNICIDQAGDIVYAKYSRSTSTLTDEDAVADALSAMKKTKFEVDTSAPNRECGQWTMTFQN